MLMGNIQKLYSFTCITLSVHCISHSADWTKFVLVNSLVLNSILYFFTFENYIFSQNLRFKKKKKKKVSCSCTRNILLLLSSNPSNPHSSWMNLVDILDLILKLCILFPLRQSKQVPPVQARTIERMKNSSIILFNL